MKRTKTRVAGESKGGGNVVTAERRRVRTEALRKLIELSEGQDAAAEIARLKAEDEFG